MFERGFSPELIWATFGVILLIAELATVTFILCFFGVGAIIVSLTTWMSMTPGINSQLVVFSASSILMTLLFRKTAKRLFSGTHDVPPDYLGERVKVIKTITAGGEGTIAYRGSDWIAYSDCVESIEEGNTVEIVAIEGIKVKVKPIT